MEPGRVSVTILLSIILINILIDLFFLFFSCNSPVVIATTGWIVTIVESTFGLFVSFYGNLYFSRIVVF